MSTDTVFAIFLTTKAITGTAIMQCVEENKLSPAGLNGFPVDFGFLMVNKSLNPSTYPARR